MPQNSANNKRIVKNTLFLYIRMLLIMVVSLFTSRVVLRTLGEVDYGIQNVVGGFITVLAFLNTTVSAAVSRYFAFEIGRNNTTRLNQYFILSFIAYFCIGIIVVIFGETVGLWFIQNKMTIPAERMTAALWVFQFSILSFLVQMFAVPYNSMIIANEKMDIYAYISILEVFLKLGIVYLLTIGDFDKLILYAILLFCTNLLTQSLYAIYSSLKFKVECHLRFFWDKTMFKELMNYSGWILFGALSGICRGQGLNIILNMFFGPVVNAARGIAYQINSAINQFVNGFYTACKPQITKLYAQGENDLMMEMVFQTSRLCYYLIFVLALPIIVQISYVLQLWLGNYPEYTPLFSKLVIYVAIVEAISYPFQGAISATGNIKWYQIVTGGLMIFTLPVAYIFLKLGYPPQTTMIISLIIAVIAQISRMIFMKVLLNMSIHAYCKDVLLRVLFVSVLSIAATLLINVLVPSHNFITLIVFCVLSFLMSGTFVYLIGISSTERNAFNKFLLSKIFSK